MLGWRIIWLVWKRRSHLTLIVRVEVSLRVIGLKGPVGLCLPTVVVVVIVGMVGGGRWRIIWNKKTCGGLTMERIVGVAVSHGLREGTGSVQQRWWWQLKLEGATTTVPCSITF